MVIYGRGGVLVCALISVVIVVVVAVAIALVVAIVVVRGGGGGGGGGDSDNRGTFFLSTSVSIVERTSSMACSAPLAPRYSGTKVGF